MKKTVLVIFLLCSGCVAFTKSTGSLDTLDASRAQAADLADRTADILVERYAPAHTSLILEKAPGAYGEALEAQLRAKGFALVPPGTRPAQPVAYSVGIREGIEPRTGYVRVCYGNGQNFSFTRPLVMVAEEEQALPAQTGTVGDSALPEESYLSPESEAIIAAALPAPETAQAPSPVSTAAASEPEGTVTQAAAVNGEGVFVQSMAEPAPVASLPIWEIRQGKMLREQMEKWASDGGYSLIWNVENDYEMTSSATFPGDFMEAVKEFFATLQANGLALRVTIYQGNRVLEISEF